MNGERRSYFWSGLFWTIVLVLFLISFSVVFVLYMKPLYYLDIGMLHLEQASGRTADVIKRNYDAMINYMYVWNRTKYLSLPDFSMSEHGVIHFLDCKRIFDVVQCICAATGILAIIGAIAHRHSLHYRYLRVAGALTIAVPASLGVLSYLNWNRVFTTFHKIFFRNNYWIFDPAADPVITILPDPFFFQCVIVIAAVLVTGALVLFSIAARRKRKLKDRIAHSRARGRRR